MVVVVDDSENSELATVDLENQLAVLGERWSTVCKWTENRYEFSDVNVLFFCQDLIYKKAFSSGSSPCFL